MGAGWVHHSRRFGHAEALREVGPEMPECESKTSTVPVVWATFGIFFQRDPNDSLSRLLTIDENWLYHYDQETKQQSMEWRHNGSPRTVPKNSKCKNPLENTRLDFLWSRWHPPHWLFSIRPNYQHGVLLISAGWIEGNFEGKKAAGMLPRLACSCTTMPRFNGHLQPRRNWPTWGFQYLDHPPYSPDLAPSEYHLFSGLKTQLKGRHFSSEMDVIPAPEIWLDGQTSDFFECLTEVRATG